MPKNRLLGGTINRFEDLFCDWDTQMFLLSNFKQTNFLFKFYLEIDCYLSRKQLKQINKQTKKKETKKSCQNMGKSNPKRKKASKNPAAKTSNRCVTDLAVVWIGKRHTTQRAQVGQKQMRAPKFLLLPSCHGDRAQ